MEKIEKGDKIVVYSNGVTVEGTVYSANYYGKRDGWYIEMENCTFKNRPYNFIGTVSYWKQGQDGGHIVSVNGKGWKENCQTE